MGYSYVGPSLPTSLPVQLTSVALRKHPGTHDLVVAFLTKVTIFGYNHANQPIRIRGHPLSLLYAILCLESARFRSDRDADLAHDRGGRSFRGDWVLAGSARLQPIRDERQQEIATDSGHPGVVPCAIATGLC